MHWKTGIPTEKDCHYLIEHPHPGCGQYSVRWVSENERCDLYDWRNLRWCILEDQTDFDAVRAEEALDDLRLWARDGEPLTPFHEWKAADVLEHVHRLEKEIEYFRESVAIKDLTNMRLRRDRDELQAELDDAADYAKQKLVEANETLAKVKAETLGQAEARVERAGTDL